ncbi:transcriptional repressor LexA, partial [Dysosmobacter welbionis]
AVDDGLILEVVAVLVVDQVGDRLLGQEQGGVAVVLDGRAVLNEDEHDGGHLAALAVGIRLNLGRAAVDAGSVLDAGVDRVIIAGVVVHHEHSAAVGGHGLAAIKCDSGLVVLHGEVGVVTCVITDISISGDVLAGESCLDSLQGVVAVLVHAISDDGAVINLIVAVLVVFGGVNNLFRAVGKDQQSAVVGEVTLVLR